METAIRFEGRDLAEVGMAGVWPFCAKVMVARGGLIT